MEVNNPKGSGRYRHYLGDLQRYYRQPLFQVSVTTVLSIVLTIIFILAAIKPTIETIIKLRKSIETAEETLVKLKAKEQAVEQAAQTYEKVINKLPYIEESVPTGGPNYEKFVKSVEIIAARNGVVLGNESLGGAVLYSEVYDPYSGIKRDVVKMPVMIKVTGQYQQVVRFANELNNLDRLIEVENLSISRGAGTRGAINTEVSLSMSGFIAYIADTDLVDKALDKKEKK